MPKKPISKKEKRSRAQSHAINKRKAIADALALVSNLDRLHGTRHLDQLVDEEKRDDLSDSLLQGLWNVRPEIFTSNIPKNLRTTKVIASIDVGLVNMGLAIVARAQDDESGAANDEDEELLRDIRILHWERFDILSEQGRKVSNANKVPHDILVNCALASLHRRLPDFERWCVSDVVIEVQPSRAGGTRAVAWGMYAFLRGTMFSQDVPSFEPRVCSATRKLFCRDFPPCWVEGSAAAKIWGRCQKHLPEELRSRHYTHECSPKTPTRKKKTYFLQKSTL